MNYSRSHPMVGMQSAKAISVEPRTKFPRLPGVLHELQHGSVNDPVEGLHQPCGPVFQGPRVHHQRSAREGGYRAVGPAGLPTSSRTSGPSRMNSSSLEGLRKYRVAPSRDISALSRGESELVTTTTGISLQRSLWRMCSRI